VDLDGRAGTAPGSGSHPPPPCVSAGHGWEAHFDLDAVLSNWDTQRSPSLELAALPYELPGPWTAAEEPEGADTAGAIRAALARGDRDAARIVAETCLGALVLHARLAPSYLGAMA
jgi:hypothetical protein